MRVCVYTNHFGTSALADRCKRMTTLVTDRRVLVYVAPNVKTRKGCLLKKLSRFVETICVHFRIKKICLSSKNVKIFQIAIAGFICQRVSAVGISNKGILFKKMYFLKSRRLC